MRAERCRDAAETVPRHHGHDRERRRVLRRSRHDDPRPGLVLRGHRVEILDDDVADPAGARRDADDLVRIERVDVDLRDGLVAYHEDTVGAELEHVPAEVFDRARRIRDQALDVVGAGPARDLVAPRIDRCRRCARGGRDRAGDEASLDGRERSVHQEPQPPRAGVHHAGRLVHGVLLARPIDRRPASIQRRAEEPLGVARLVTHGILHLLECGEHRAAGGLRDGGEGVRPGELEGLLHVDALGIPGVLHPADHLTEEDAAVATSSHERSVGRAGEDRGRLVLGLAGMLDRAAHRVEHVRAGVAIRDGVHVERVHFVDVGFEPRGRGIERGEQRRCVTACYDGPTLPAATPSRSVFVEVRSLMPRACAICGKSASFGSNVSHSKVHTARRFDANLHNAVIDGRKLLVCTRCRRTATKPARMARKAAKTAA